MPPSTVSEKAGMLVALLKQLLLQLMKEKEEVTMMMLRKE